MSTQTFSTVAHTVVGQYSQVGKIIVGAYRTGAQRLVSGANARYVDFLNSRALPLVSEEVKASLIDVQQQIAGAFVGGITTGSDRAEQAIDLVAGGVNGSIARAVATVDRVETAFDTKAITTVGQLTMPVAQVSLEIANRAVEGTKRLSARVVGVEDEVEQVVKTVKRVAKKATRRVAKARA
ncbi:MAG: hypothetical protein V4844_14805 [Pseudomonadota bacterium]|jgi:hypothetical protein